MTTTRKMTHLERKLANARNELALFEKAEGANPIYVKTLADRVAVLERKVASRAPKTPSEYMDKSARATETVTAVPEAPAPVPTMVAYPPTENAPPADADDAPPLERPAVADLLD